MRPEVVSRADGQKQFDERRASALFILPAGLDVAALNAGSAEVELLQQPSNLNAMVAERAILTALRSVSSAVGAANNAVSQREKQMLFASEADKQTYFEQSLETARQLQAEAPQRVTVVKGNTPEQQVIGTRAPTRLPGN